MTASCSYQLEQWLVCSQRTDSSRYSVLELQSRSKSDRWLLALVCHLMSESVHICVLNKKSAKHSFPSVQQYRDQTDKVLITSMLELLGSLLHELHV